MLFAQTGTDGLKKHALFVERLFPKAVKTKTRKDDERERHEKPVQFL